MPSPYHRVLITGAFEPEIDLLAKTCHKRLLSPSKLLSLHPSSKRKEKEEQPRGFSNKEDLIRIEVFELGVGPIESALSLQEKILGLGFEERGIGEREEQDSPSSAPLALPSPAIQEILFLGSAGIYTDKSSSDHMEEYSYGLSCYAQSSTFYFYDLAALKGEGKLPAALGKQVQSKAGPLGRALGEHLQNQSGIRFFPDLSVNTTASLSLLSPKIPKTKGKALFHIENMEAFALAQLALRYAIPFSAFFSLTNRVGPEGSREWEKNYSLMSIDLQKRFIKFFQLRE